MAEGRTPLYLARRSYRRRRLIDALRLLPILMFGLWLLPLVWGGAGTDQPLGAGSRSFVHVFSVWALGLGAAAWIARLLMRNETPSDTFPAAFPPVSEPDSPPETPVQTTAQTPVPTPVQTLAKPQEDPL